MGRSLLKEVIDWRVINGELTPVRVMMKVEVKLGKPAGHPAWNKGKTWDEIYSPEMKARQLEYAKSKLEQMRTNSIKTRKGKPAVNSNPVLMLHPLTGNVIGRFYSSREAMRKTGINERNIRKACTGDRKATGGYKWRYE